MSEWIRTARLSEYDVISAFSELSEIDWRKSGFKIKEGDIVYIYVGVPYSKVIYKTICVIENVKPEEVIDDTQFWVNQSSNEDGDFVRLRLISRVNDERLSLQYLQSEGLVKQRIQGAYRSSKYPELFEHITVVFDGDAIGLSNIVIENNASREGKKVAYYTTKYERNPKNREAALRIHGYKCQICGFDFEETYGELGKGFIEVHHLKPLYSLEEEEIVNPEHDLICVCSNCHRMLHKRKNSIISPEELKRMMDDAKQ